jgi:pimeloyl-ACP methyl ester carboxylesterase
VRKRVPALVGGALGLATAIAAVGVAHSRRQGDRTQAPGARTGLASGQRVGMSAAAVEPDRRFRVRTTDGISLYAEETGSTDAPLIVLFVHGFTLNSQSFRYQQAALREAFGADVRLVCYDQRSHGRSDRSPAGGSRIEQLASDLDSVLDAILADEQASSARVVLVGHSMGGMTVLAHADRFPHRYAQDTGRVAAVALINTSGGRLADVTFGLPRVLARLRGPVLPVVLRHAAANVDLVERGRLLGKDLARLATKRFSFGSTDIDPEVVDFASAMISATPVDVVSEFYGALMAHEALLAAENLRDTPVLLIGAERDALTPIVHTRQLAETLPDATVVEVADTGHLLMLEKPSAVNGPLIELIRSVGTA